MHAERQNRPLLRLAAQTGWGFADQALSSLTNFALSVIVARTASPADFGAFALGMATYWAVLAITRAVTSQPLAVRFSAVETSEWRDAVRAALGAVVVLGVIGSVGFAVAAWATDGTLAVMLLTAGIGLPGLLLRDAFRFAFFTAGDGRSAFANQLLWSVLLVAGLAFVLLVDAPRVSGPVLVWAGTAAVAAAAGCIQAGLLPRPRAARAWWTAQKDIAGRFAAESLVGVAASQLYLYGIGAIAGFAAVAAIRAAEIVLGPLQILVQGIQLAAVPYAVKMLRVSRRRLLITAALLSSGLCAAAIAWGIVAIALPASVGRALIGESWPGAQAILLPMTAVFVGLSITTGAYVGLRALAAARLSLRASVVAAALIATGALVGSTHGPGGAAWGLALTGLVSAAVFWIHFYSALSDSRS